MKNIIDQLNKISTNSNDRIIADIKRLSSCFAYASWIAGDLNLKIKTINRHLIVLEDKGIVTKQICPENKDTYLYKVV